MIMRSGHHFLDLPVGAISLPRAYRSPFSKWDAFSIDMNAATVIMMNIRTADDCANHATNNGVGRPRDYQ